MYCSVTRCISVLLTIFLLLGGVPVCVQAAVQEQPWDTSVSWGRYPVYSALQPGVSYFTGEEWSGQQNCVGVDGNAYNANQVVQVNRLDAHTSKIVPYDSVESAKTGAETSDYTLSPYYQLLTGEGQEWSLAVYKNVSAAQKAGVDTEFYKEDYNMSVAPKYEGDGKVGSASTAYYGGFQQVTLPASWQTQGFDFPIYSNFTYPWGGVYGNANLQCPLAPTLTNPVGYYRRTFTVADSWLSGDKRIILSFQGVESAFYLYVNGYQVGYSEDSFDSAEFDITNYVHRDGSENVLAVKVFRWSDGSFLENQDMIRLSGIFRDVYLYATPSVYLRDYTLVTDLDENYTDASLQLSVEMTNASTNRFAQGFAVDVALFDAEGNNIFAADPLRGTMEQVRTDETGTLQLSRVVQAPHLWSDEDPYLYTMVLTLYNADTGAYFESIAQQVGFREITFTRTQVDENYNNITDYYQTVLLNGKPFQLYGVNRHDTSPYTGHYVSHELYETDARMMKETNVNAVRTSHYPNDEYFYDLCDRYGILVLAECNIEFGANSDDMDTYFANAVQDRVTNLMEREKNRTSVIMWSFGNEAGGSPNSKIIHRTISDLMKSLDTTRPVHYEALDNNGGVDVASRMYASVTDVWNRGTVSNHMPFLICEYAHGMGNSIGNLEEYWEALHSADNLLGGFIWDWVDQALATEVPDGKFDYYASVGQEELAGYYLATGGCWEDVINDGSVCANGIISADRTPQDEAAEVKYVYSKVQFSADTQDMLTRTVQIQNQNSFRNLSDYEIRWELLEDGLVIDSGSMVVDCAAGNSVSVQVPFTMPETLVADGEYLLNVYASLREATAWCAAGFTVETEQFAVPASVPRLPNATGNDSVISQETIGSTIVFSGEDFQLSLDQTTGQIQNYTYAGNMLMEEGPAPNYWRATLDNDRDFSLDTKWQYANKNMTLRSCQVSMEEDGTAATVQVEWLLSGAGNSTQSVTYRIYNTGEIQVSATLNPDSSMGELLRYGAELTLPKAFENIIWYGYGPGDTFCDRYQGSQKGIWQSTVTDSFFPYCRIQSCGTKTGVAYFAVEDPESDIGLLVVSDSEMEASALHYKTTELQAPTFTLQDGNYLYNLAEDNDYTILELDYGSRGTGGESCGPGPLADYRLYNDGRDYTYSYTLVPYTVAQTDLFTLSKSYRDAESFNLDAFNIATAAEVDTLISRCTTILSDAQLPDIKAARSAYDRLTEDQKALVTKYDVLTAAEQTVRTVFGATASVLDRSGNALHAVITDSAVIYEDETSPTGFALEGNFVVPSSTVVDAAISGACTFTVALWVNPADLATDNTFFAKGDTQVTLKTNQVGLEFFVFNGGWYDINVPYPTSFQVGQWSLLVGTYDGSKLKLYCNGELIGERDGPAGVGRNEYSLGIGKCLDPAYPSRVLRGSLASAQLYHTALTQTQISALYNGTGDEFQEDLVFWYDASQFATEGGTTMAVLGDMNQDDKLSVTDVVLLRKAILAGKQTNLELELGDMNRDGNLSVTDVVLLRKAILQQT